MHDNHGQNINQSFLQYLGKFDRFDVVYRKNMYENKLQHQLFINRKKPFFEMIISTNPEGIHAQTTGMGVQTLNGKQTMGKYPVRWTIPGEVTDERISKIITKDIISVMESQGEYINKVTLPNVEKHNKDIMHRVNSGLKILLQNRGKIDIRNEMPNNFIQNCPDEWIKRGQKGSGLSNWMQDLHTSMFFTQIKDQRDRMTDNDFEKIFKNVAKNTLSIDNANREIYAKNQLQLYIDVKNGVDIGTKKGFIKEKIWGHKHWEKLLPVYETFLTKGILESKNIIKILDVDKNKDGNPIYIPILSRHIEQIEGWEKIYPQRGEYREKFFDLLIKWPKTAEMGELLNDAFNAGIPMEIIVDNNIKNRKPLEDLIEIAKIANKRNFNANVLNESYQPPDLDLHDKKIKEELGINANWEFATYKTFTNLSSHYSNCISTSGYYEQLIAKGDAFVIYLPNRGEIPNGENKDFNEAEQTSHSYRKEGSGAVAFCTRELNNVGWRVSEILAFANRRANPIFEKEAKNIVDKINKIHPDSYPEMKKNIVETAGNLVQNFIIEKNKWNQANSNIRNINFSPEIIDKIFGIEELRKEAIERSQQIIEENKDQNIAKGLTR